ncbi:winged helix-turn-helix transcriptional regulator [Candidatus Woesearchaeota archaeon]|nr:winged helix-turn-helix transcriptional regulator [Candidatus Woesearchaeota archaeon]
MQGARRKDQARRAEMLVRHGSEVLFSFRRHVRRISMKVKRMVKEKERQIIEHMRQGKRFNISAIARRLNLPISTVSDRIRRIEKDYVMKRISLLNFPSTGHYANALLAMKVEGQKDRMLEFLRQDRNVNSIYHTNTNFTFLVDVVCRQNHELVQWMTDVKDRFQAEILPFHILKVEEKERFVP